MLGLRWGRIAAFGAAGLAVSEIGDAHLVLALEDGKLPPDPVTDLGLLNDGYASVTSILGIQAAPPVQEANAHAESIFRTALGGAPGTPAT